ncbi:MAG: tripartite tricarboxylate transporter TctB family protein [Rhodobacteraceae bacterium]|nr:tripartite tricarboxylate transporter TctB family protein [Paracoccaceae bacterium]
MSTSQTHAKPIDRTLLFESIFIMVFATAMFATTYTFDKVPAILAQGIQPTVFPRAVLVVMFLLAALQAFKATRLTPQQVSDLKPVKAVPPIVFLTAGLLMAFAALMPIIGTFPAIVLFLPALALLWGERRGLLMSLSFLGFLGFAYVLFGLIMNVPLP